MKRFVAVFGLCAALLQPALAAEASPDPLLWLGKVASASQRLNYVGTFIYQSGRDFETSRIAHKVDASGEYERLEVLDGSPREVTRANGEVRCVLPRQKTVIIDQPGGRRAFPARLPTSLPALAESYQIRMGDVGRVAGLEAQAIVLEPRDDLRYGHVFWADTQSGLLLKSKTVDERGEVIEQFMFSDIKVGGSVDRELLRSRYDQVQDWRVVNLRGSEMPKAESGWTVRAPLPGFSLVSVMRRPLGREGGEAVHMLFSDGLASISVFVEPMGSDGAQGGLGAQASGAINIYKRTLNGHLVTALGEVPQRAVQRLGDAVEAVAR